MRSVYSLLLSFLLTVGSLWAQGNSGERVLFHAKIFTAEPESPYAEAVSIRGDKIVAVGTLPEVLKSVSAGAERVDLEGKTLFPGFIDSHSHSIDGGLSLIGADATDKVDTLDQLPAFVDEAKKNGRGVRGDVLEIQGLPLAFWSHPDVLNKDFSTEIGRAHV